MSLDQDLKGAFERHASDISPEPGTWSGVERRIRRSHRIRASLATAGGAVAVIAMALAVPALVRNRTAAPPFANEGPTPPPATAETTIFRNERDGYWLQVPKDWEFGEFEAHVSFRPPGVPGLEEGGRTFGVELWVDTGAYDDPARIGDDGGQGSGDTTVAGRSAKVRDTTLISHPPVKNRTYLVDWTGAYCPPGAPCPVTGQWVLMVVIHGTADLWDDYSGLGESIVRSITLSASSTMPANTAVATRRGSVDAAVPYDETTGAVVRFMEARIEGGEAEAWLTSNAKKQYDSHEGQLSLYSPNEKISYSSYKIESRAEVDANSFEYMVLIEYFETSASSDERMGKSFHETLGVGPSGGLPVAIRFATRS